MYGILWSFRRAVLYRRKKKTFFCASATTAARQKAGRIYNWLRREIRERLIQQRIDSIEGQGLQQTRGRKKEKEEETSTRRRSRKRWIDGMAKEWNHLPLHSRGEKILRLPRALPPLLLVVVLRFGWRVAGQRRSIKSIDKSLIRLCLGCRRPLLTPPPFLPPLHGCCCHNTTTTTMAPSLPYLAAPSLSIRLSFISQRDGRAEKADRWGRTERER